MSVVPIDNGGDEPDPSADGAQGTGPEPVTAGEQLNLLPVGLVGEASSGLVALRPDIDWKVDTAVVPALRRDLYAPQRFAYPQQPQQRFVYVPIPPERPARPMRRPAPLLLRMFVGLVAVLAVAAGL